MFCVCAQCVCACVCVLLSSVGVGVSISCWHQHSSESGEMGDNSGTEKSKLVSKVVYLSAKALQHLEAENEQAANDPAAVNDGRWCGKKTYLCDSDDSVFQLRRMHESDSNDGFTFTIWVKGDYEAPVKFKTDSNIEDLDIFELEALSLAEYVPSVDQGQAVNVTSLHDGSLMVEKKRAFEFYNFKGFLNKLSGGKLQTLQEVMQSTDNLKIDTICV